MGVLNAGELQGVRNACERTISVTYTKAQLNAASQAIEDWLADNSAAVSALINTATTPLVLTNPQKKKLFAEVVRLKYERDK